MPHVHAPYDTIIIMLLLTEPIYKQKLTSTIALILLKCACLYPSHTEGKTGCRALMTTKFSVVWGSRR